jgi:hypothetical protein
MKRLKVYYLLTLFVVISACSDDEETAKPEPGNDRIKLSGIVTGARTSRDNIYVKAFFPDLPIVYFDETPVTLSQGISPNETINMIFPDAAPCYPLDDDTEISVFAYSGKAPNDRMVLTAGTTLNNDALLSNCGKRRSDPEVVLSYAPSGTPGSSANPAVVLQFRHVMTQVNVSVAIDPDSPADQLPTSLQVRINGAVASGRYAIRAKESDLADCLYGTYTLQLGTNYLVPSGIDLIKAQLAYLVIDDYQATPQDLAGFAIQPFAAQQLQQKMKLMPGYAYNLVFTLGRLGVRSITLQKVN